MENFSFLEIKGIEMKKVWLTALLSLFPAVAGAEVYTLPGVVVTAENRKETKDTVFLPHETLTEKDMERMGASNVVEALSTALGGGPFLRKPGQPDGHGQQSAHDTGHEQQPDTGPCGRTPAGR